MNVSVLFVFNVIQYKECVLQRNGSKYLIVKMGYMQKEDTM